MKIMNRNTSPISPFGPDHYQAASQSSRVSQYPEEEINRFKRNYSRLSQWPEDQMELANGSDEWIQKLMIVLGQDRGAMTLDPDFFMYTDYAQQIGVELSYVKANEDFNFDLKKVAAAIKKERPGFFIFSNPQNPTAHQFDDDDIQLLVQAVEEAESYLVIDEAYAEFASDYQRPAHDRVIYLRTMSKWYGMAGLRIGIMHAQGPVFDRLTAINHPYPLNSLVLNLACEFLEDSKALDSFISYQKEAKSRLVQAFDLVKDQVKVKDSATNFVFTYGPAAVDLGRYLESQGYLGRFYEAEDLSQVVRYSILALEDYDDFEDRLREWRGR